MIGSTPNGNPVITNSIVRLIKGYSTRMIQYFVSGNVIVGLDLCNYDTKVDLKGTTGIDKSTWESTTDLTTFNTKSNDWNIDKINTVPTDLNKLSNIVDNDVVKKTVYDKFLIKLNAFDTKY